MLSNVLSKVPSIGDTTLDQEIDVSPKRAEYFKNLNLSLKKTCSLLPKCATIYAWAGGSLLDFFFKTPASWVSDISSTVP